MTPLMVFGRDSRCLLKTARKAADYRPFSRQTRSATYVLPFPEQKGKMGCSAAPSTGPQEQCAPRYPLESSPIFEQVTGGKQALESEQFTVTPYAVDCTPHDIDFTAENVDFEVGVHLTRQ
jgi:hypothetical protein